MIGAAIYGILSGATGVTSLISTRIYPDIAPQNAARQEPAVVADRREPVGPAEAVDPAALRAAVAAAAAAEPAAHRGPAVVVEQVVLQEVQVLVALRVHQALAELTVYLVD